jgi:hypothetical protein
LSAPPSRLPSVDTAARGARFDRKKGVVMTHVGCRSCRLRFTPAAAAYLVACPECGRPLQPIVGAEGVVGFRLIIPEDVPHELPEAVAVSIPIDPTGAWS